jgi:hypothetical protein
MIQTPGMGCEISSGGTLSFKGRVLNFKLDSFGSYQQDCIVFLLRILYLKTQPSFYPVV